MKNKVTGLLKFILVIAVLVNAVDLSFLSIKAMGDEQVAAYVNYNEDNTIATIEFDVSNVSEDKIITQIITPNGDSMDVDATYDVEENGTYTFIINYEDVLDNSITSSELKNVDVTDLLSDQTSESIDLDSQEDIDATIDIETSSMILDSTHTFSTPGVTLTNYSVENNALDGNHFYVYLKDGEHFQFTTKYGGAGNWNQAATKGNYYITAPDGTQTIVKFPEGSTNNSGTATPHSTRGTYSTTITAQSEGIYTVAPVRTANDLDVWHNLNFNVEDVDGNYVSGRVWSDNIRLKQSHLRGTNGRYKFVEDFTFYHVTATGYIYKQDLFNYNGINSVVFSDPVGNMVSSAGNCTPLYGDIPQMSTLYSALNDSEYCKQQISSNHLFLEYPNADLPASGSVQLLNTNGTLQNASKETHVLPLISENVPTIHSLTFERHTEYSYAGTFSTNIDNAQGFASLEIDLDDDRDGKVDRTISRLVFINENGTSTYVWDGLDDNGVKIPYTTSVSANVAIKTAGEIHFNRQDVEQSLGMSVVRLTGTDPSTIGDDTLYYNANLLPINFNKSTNVQMFSLAAGSYDSTVEPGRHSWNYIGYGSSATDDKRNTYAPRLGSFDGRPTSYEPNSWGDPTKHSDSLGDGNYMEDWTFERIYLLFDLDLDMEQPGVGIEKSVDINQAAYTDGLQLEYTITVMNKEDFEVVDYTVIDELKNLNFVSYVDGSLTVDGIKLDTDVAYYDKASNSVVVNYDSMASGAVSVIKFKVTVKEDAIGEIIENQAKLVNSLTPDVPVFSENVTTKIHNLSLIKEVDKENALVGDTLTYKLIVTNSSEFTVSNYLVSDMIADIDGVKYLDGTLTVDGQPLSDEDDADYGSVIQDTVNVYYPSIEASQISVIEFQVEVLDIAKGKVLTNVATLQSITDNPLDPNGPIISNEVKTKVPDVSINKLVDMQFAQVGDTVTYTVSVTNNSDFDIENYDVNDKINDTNKVSYKTSSIKVNGVAQTDSVDSDYASFKNSTVNVKYPVIASKQTTTFTFEVIIQDAAKGDIITNVAVLESNDDTIPPVDSNEVSTALDNVSIVKAVDKELAAVGDTITYTLTVKNNSGHAVNNFSVQDTIDDLAKSGYVLNSIEVDGQSMTDAYDNDDADYSQGTVTVNIPSLASAQELTITFKITVLQDASGKTIINTALLLDPNDADNNIPSNKVETLIPDVTIKKEVNKEVAQVGDKVKYTVTVTNNSDFDVFDYYVSDQIVNAGQVTYVANSIKVDGSSRTDLQDTDSADYSNDTINVSFAKIASKKKSVFTFEVTLEEAAKGEVITNVAVLNPNNPALPPVDSNEVTTVLDNVTIEKSVSKQTAKVGETLTYSLTVTNHSKHDVVNYTVADTIQDLNKADYIVDSIEVDGQAMTDAKDEDNANYTKSTVNVLLPVLVAEQVTTITFKVTISEKALGKTLENTAVLHDPKYPKDDSVSNKVVTEVPNLSISKEVDKQYATVGEVITYTIKVANNSTFEVEGYSVIDNVQHLIDAGYNPNSITVDGVAMTDAIDMDIVSYVDGTLIVSYPTLAPKQTSIISFNITVTQEANGQVLANVATLETNDPEVPPLYSEEVVTLLNDISITKSVDKTTAKVGDTITYSLTVINHSAHDVSDISVVDAINNLDHVNYVANSITVDGVALTDLKDSDDAKYSKGKISVLYSTLLQGQESIITFSVVVTQKADGKSITNVATLHDANFPDDSKTSNEVVTEIPSITIAKSVDKKTAKVGETLTYKIDVTNNSDFAVTGYTVTDKIQNLNYVSYNVNSITLDGQNMTDIVDMDAASYLGDTVSVILPTLESSQKMTITFSVTVLDEAVKNSVINVALLNSIVDPENPISSNEVITKVKSNSIIDLPNTGIENNVLASMLMMIISGLALVVIGRKRTNISK